MKALSIVEASERLRAASMKYAKEEMNESPCASELYGAALEFACAKLADWIAKTIREALGRDDARCPCLDSIASESGRAALRFLLREARNR